MPESCFLCNEKLTDSNRTVEHIIPETIGGRLTSSSVICRACNSNLGNTVDSAFYKQMGVLAEVANIYGRNKYTKHFINAYDKDGEKIKLLQGLKSPYVLRMENTQTKKVINLYAPSESELLKLARRKKAEIERKGGEVPIREEDFEIVEEKRDGNVHFANSESDGQIGFVFGTKAFFNECIKIAIEFALINDVPSQTMYDIIEHFKGDSSMFKRYCTFYYPPDVIEREKNIGIYGKIYHLIYLRGDNNTNSLYCYIDLLGVQKVVCLLNCAYRERDFEALYYYDLQMRQEEQINFSLIVSESFLSSIPFANTNYQELAHVYLTNYFGYVSTMHRMGSEEL